MHDIDRVRLETQADGELFAAGPLEAEYFELGEAEAPWQGQREAVFSETEEMELASAMLDITHEAELDRFVGGLLKRAGRAVGTFVRSPTGQALGGLLKGAAKQVLPTLGSALGGYVGGATGAQLGSQAAAASQLFGVELEGLSPEDQEFEVARRYVRFAGEAVKHAALAPTRQDPRRAAQDAAVAAAETHAPGLLQAPPASPPVTPPSARLPLRSSGRWVRHGNTIVLYGI
jgi:hypothetical protein